jgi:hypothetical protein
MKNLKTTVIGLLLSVLIAAEPILSGSGYHLDAATTLKLIAAVLVALKGFYTEDAK